MGKYVTRKEKNIYKTVIQQVNKDLGRTVLLYIRSGHNEAIPWDTVTDEPESPEEYPDSTAWYTYTEKRIENVGIIWGDQMSRYYSAGRFEPHECELTVRLEDVLIDKSDPESATYFDQMEYCIVDGKRCVKKSVVTKMGLQELYMCKVTVTSKLE
jgi:hypothetical protein